MNIKSSLVLCVVLSIVACDVKNNSNNDVKEPSVQSLGHEITYPLDEHVSVYDLDLQDAEGDAINAVKIGKCKLFVVRGYSYMTLHPKVDLHASRKAYGVVIIDESQDSPRTTLQAELNNKANQYTKKYNAVILQACKIPMIN